MKVKVSVTQSCPTLCNPMSCSPPASSLHGILQARILEWVAIPFSKGSSQPRKQTCLFHLVRRLPEPPESHPPHTHNFKSYIPSKKIILFNAASEVTEEDKEEHHKGHNQGQQEHGQRSSFRRTKSIQGTFLYPRVGIEAPLHLPSVCHWDIKIAKDQSLPCLYFFYF